MPDRIALPPKAQTKPQNHLFHHQIIISTHTYLSALFREILTTFDRQGTGGAPGRCNMLSPSGIPTTLEVVAGMPPCLGRGEGQSSLHLPPFLLLKLCSGTVCSQVVEAWTGEEGVPRGEFWSPGIWHGAGTAYHSAQPL